MTSKTKKATDFAYLQALKDVLGLILLSYKKCYKCYYRAMRENNKEHITNFAGRMDELTLLYSDIKGCNFNEAKEELKKRTNGT